METKTYTLDEITEAGRIRALCAHLECEPGDLSRERYEHFGLALFDGPGGQWAIGTDEEADEACAEYVKDSAWAFNADFILSECGLPYSGVDSLRRMQGDSCEGANDFILALIEKTCGLDKFTQSAISSDGRGHFLSGYDGNESEQDAEDAEGYSVTYYIYRTN